LFFVSAKIIKKQIPTTIINYQLSIINYQLSIINYQLSINQMVTSKDGFPEKKYHHCAVHKEKSVFLQAF
jgi:hypothetical protein